jgi:hypothetical protein
MLVHWSVRPPTSQSSASPSVSWPEVLDHPGPDQAAIECAGCSVGWVCVIEEPTVKSWGTQRSKRPRPFFQKLLSHLSTWSLAVPQLGGEVGLVQGEWEPFSNPGSCSAVTATGLSDPVKASPVAIVLRKSLQRRHREGFVVSSHSLLTTLAWALCSWKLPHWTWRPGPRRQSVVRVAAV